MGKITDTLLLPLREGAVPAPQSNCLFLNAEAFSADPRFTNKVTCVQGFRAQFLTLQKAGFQPVPELGQAGDEAYPLAMFLTSKHKALNNRMLVEAISRLQPDGYLLAAGEKKLGIAPLIKHAASNHQIAGKLSKNHALVFWMQANADAIASAKKELDAPWVQEHVEGFITAPGMFSHDRPDPASRLLAEFLDDTVRGAVADFGAGWGYLAKTLLMRSSKIERLDLYEADFASLEAARQNINTELQGLKSDTFWLDLTSEPVSRKYNTVIMNPPFHQGRHGEPQIGQAFIEKALSALQPGGELRMVANRHLPYEQTLQALFRKVEPLAERDGFKVVRAIT